MELGSSLLQKSKDVSQMNLEFIKATIKCLFIIFHMRGGSVSQNLCEKSDTSQRILEIKSNQYSCPWPDAWGDAVTVSMQPGHVAHEIQLCLRQSSKGMRQHWQNLGLKSINTKICIIIFFFQSEYSIISNWFSPHPIHLNTYYKVMQIY